MRIEDLELAIEQSGDERDTKGRRMARFRVRNAAPVLLKIALAAKGHQIPCPNCTGKHICLCKWHGCELSTALDELEAL